MATVNLKSLIGKLNTTCTRTLEAAAGICLSRTNYNVEIEHWLLKLLEGTPNDILTILKFYSLSHAKISADITRAIDKLKTGNSSQPLLSQHIVDLAESTIDGCDAAGVFVVQNGAVVTAAASAPMVNTLDRLQIEANEGPCLDASVRGTTFYAHDLADDERWPTFGPRAVDAGAHETPLKG